MMEIEYAMIFDAARSATILRFVVGDPVSFTLTSAVSGFFRAIRVCITPTCGFFSTSEGMITNPIPTWFSDNFQVTSTASLGRFEDWLSTIKTIVRFRAHERIIEQYGKQHNNNGHHSADRRGWVLSSIVIDLAYLLARCRFEA